jgi:integrase
MGARVRKRLSAVGVNALKEPGYHADGDGLYLQVTDSGAKTWVLRFSLNKRAREMGLGSISKYTLAEARETARHYRQMLDHGIDPIEQRRAERDRNLATTAQRRTFEECTREYYKLHEGNWRNAKNAKQWINTMILYAFPAFGNKDVSSVDKADVLRVLEPIWAEKAETASRVRQRIRAILDWASARDYRLNHDPHMWDQIGRSLPKSKNVKNVKHFPSCPYPGVYDALQSIKNSPASDSVKLAFEFIVINAARSGEVRGALWSEIDFERRRWIIPADRMKAGQEHRVPLSPRAIEILESQHGNGSGLVFPSEKGRAFSDMTFSMALRRLGHDFTVHGFRSTFRDWCAEQTAYPREVCEAALAHSAGKNPTEAAYLRTDLFDKRRQLMEAWATYCATPKAAAQVVGIGQRTA